MTPQELAKVQKDIRDLTDNFEQLQYSLTKKIGSGSNTIQGIIDDPNASNVQIPLSAVITAGEALVPNDAVYIKKVGLGAFDMGDCVENASTGFTRSLTIGDNSNRILLVQIHGLSSGALGSLAVTFNGVSMTLLADVNYVTTFHTYIYILVAPAVGTHNLSATWTGGNTIDASSWAGYNFTQNATPDATKSTTGTGDTYSGSITTVSDGDWIISFAGGDGGAVLTNNTNFTLRAGFGRDGVGDTNGLVTPAGATTTTATTTSGNHWSWYQVALSPITVPTYQVLKASALSTATSNSFKGFNRDTVAKDDDATVFIQGMVTTFSGLTPGSFYYLSNTLGAISTTPGAVTRKCGIAINTKTLLITNLW